MKVKVSITKTETAGNLPQKSLLQDTPVDGLHPDEPELPSDTRCYCNIHVTLQEAVQQNYTHGMGPETLEEDAMKVAKNRALLGRSTHGDRSQETD